MNDLILGIPIWIWITTSVILSIIEATFILQKEDDVFKVMFVILLNPVFLFAPAFIFLLIFILNLIFNSPKLIKDYFEHKKKDKNINEPIKIFANFDSNSTVRYYSIEQEDQRIDIETDSLDFILNIKECLELKEIDWSDIKFDGYSYGERLEEKVKRLKEKRIINKIEIN